MNTSPQIEPIYEELAECPQCDTRVKPELYQGGHQMRCQVCGAQGYRYETPDLAIANFQRHYVFGTKRKARLKIAPIPSSFTP
jgi:hypothetical protein